MTSRFARFAIVLAWSAAALLAQNSTVRWMRGGPGFGFVNVFAPRGAGTAITYDGYLLKWWRLSDGVQLRTAIPFPLFYYYESPGVLSPDGSLIALYAHETDDSAFGKLKLIRTADGIVQATVSGLPYGDIAFSPDSQTVAMGGDTVRLIGAADGRLLRLLTYIDGYGAVRTWSLWRIAFSPDGQWLTGRAGPVIDAPLMSIPVGGGATALAYSGASWGQSNYSPDGRWLAIGTAEPATYVTTPARACVVTANPALGYCPLPDPPLPSWRESSPVFSPDSSKVLTWGCPAGYGSLSVFARSTGTWQPLFSSLIGSRYCAVTYAFTSDERTFVTADSYVLKLWDADSGTPIRRLSAHTGSVFALAWSGDGSRLFTGGVYASGAADAAVHIWNGADGAPAGEIAAQPGDVQTLGIALSPNGAYAAVSTNPGIHVYRLSDGALVYTIPDRFDPAWSPDGKTLAAAHGDELWTYRGSDGVFLKSTPAAVGGTFAYTPDGSRILTHYAYGVGMNRASDLSFIGVLNNPISPYGVNSVAISSDGALVAGGLSGSTASDPQVSLWRVADGAFLGSFGQSDGHNMAVAFAPDGKTLAVGGYGATVSILSVPDGARLHTFHDEVKCVFTANTSVQMLAYSPDGSKLAWSRFDGTVVVADNPFYDPPKPSDVTPPVIPPPAIAGVAGANGWFTGDVAVTWTATDPESGVVTSCAPTTLTANTPGVTVTCAATNGAGLTASRSVVVKIDKTPPSISVPTVTGTLGNNGWYRSAVTAVWTIADDESGIASTAGCVPPTLTTDMPAATLTCTATNGAGLSSTASVVVKVDATPPAATATRTPAPNGNGWNNSPVTVTFPGTDGTSGVASCSAPVTLAADGRGQVASGACLDNAGNSSAPANVTVNLDRTPPAIAGMPAAGCSLWPVNQKLVTVATVTASDALSGPSSFQVTATSNEPNDPRNPSIVIARTAAGGYTVQLLADRSGKDGDRVYTVVATATDLAGNTVSAKSTCTVPHDQSK
jgi:WD40 repeat protein